MFSLTYYVDDYKIFNGKILGFIDRTQFYRLFKEPVKFARKIGSGDVKTLDSIADLKDFKDHRLVFSTTVDGERHLLVTGEIVDKCDFLIKNKMALSMVDSHNNFIYIDDEV